MLKRNPILATILLIIILFTISPWTQTGVPATDDFRHHLTKFWAINEGVQNDFTVPAWNQNVYGGWPIFQFYHSLPYVALLPFNFLLDAIGMLKLNMLVALLLGIPTMFITAKRFTNEQTALIATIIYALAPMHFEFAYISGSISRVWAWALLPLVFLTFIDMLEKPSTKHIARATLTFALLMWSHLNVAYAATVLLSIYIAYHYTQTKQLPLKRLIPFALLTLLLLTFWLVPMLLESAESTSSQRTPKILGNEIPATPAQELLSRGFGRSPHRHFYVGISVLLLAAAALLTKFKYKTPFALLSATALILTLWTFPLRLLPLLLIDYAYYFTLAALPLITILAALGLKALAKIPNSKLALYALLIIVCIDLAPALTTYDWVESENFVNPPELVQVWRDIAKEKGQFRVYSPIGQVPYMYHNKFEVGTEWMGYREGALLNIRTFTDQLERDFRANPLSPEVIQRLEYTGVKYLVIPCAQIPTPPTYQRGQFCAYQLNAAPLISPLTSTHETPTNLTHTTAYCNECNEQLTQATITNPVVNQEEITFTTTTPNKTKVLVRVAHFTPRWRAYANNNPTQITSVYPHYMMVDVPEGTSAVTLHFESNLTHLLANAISLVALALLLYIYKRPIDLE